jgi:integrase/recombinase XerD
MKPLGELFKTFRDDKRYLLNVSKKTLLGYDHAWKVFGPHLEAIDDETAIKPAVKAAIVEIQKDARKRKREDARKKPITDGSINTYLTVINALLNWAHKEDLMDRLIKITKLKTLKKVRTTLTTEEVEQFLAWKPNGLNETRIKMMVMIGLDTGLRLKEIRMLKRDEIDLENMLLKVYSGKGRKQRIVPFSAELRKALYRYTRDSSALMTDGFLFGTTGRKLYSQRNAARDLAIVCNKVGIRNITWHQLRHTFGTEYLRRGGDISKLRRILGHSTITVTQIYEHLNTEDIQEGFDRLSSINVRQDRE